MSSSVKRVFLRVLFSDHEMSNSGTPPLLSGRPLILCQPLKWDIIMVRSSVYCTLQSILKVWSFTNARTFLYNKIMHAYSLNMSKIRHFKYRYIVLSKCRSVASMQHKNSAYTHDAGTARCQHSELLPKHFCHRSDAERDGRLEVNFARDFFSEIFEKCSVCV